MTYGPFDAQVELRAGSKAAATTTTAEPGIAFDATYAGDFKAVVAVSELAGTGTYTLSIETDKVKAFDGTVVEIATAKVTRTGIYEIPLSGAQIEHHDPDAAAIRVKATLGGATPSIKYAAYLVPAF